jgi:hypothetical protein
MRLTQGRHTQIHERLMDRATAETAFQRLKRHEPLELPHAAVAKRF